MARDHEIHGITYSDSEGGGELTNLTDDQRSAICDILWPGKSATVATNGMAVSITFIDGVPVYRVTDAGGHDIIPGIRADDWPAVLAAIDIVSITFIDGVPVYRVTDAGGHDIIPGIRADDWPAVVAAIDSAREAVARGWDK